MDFKKNLTAKFANLEKYPLMEYSSEIFALSL
jgi:hypothetical protein